MSGSCPVPRSEQRRTRGGAGGRERVDAVERAGIELDADRREVLVQVRRRARARDRHDLLALRDKVTTAESQLASSKLETTAAEEKLTAANGEIARLKAAAALPPMGSAMDKKR